MNEKPVLVSLSRSPFEIFMLLACILSGIAGLIDPYASTISKLLPPWQLYLWNAGIALGGLATLIGALGGRYISLHIERIGLTFLTGLSSVYVIAVLSYSGLKFGLAVSVTLAFTAASVFRLREIQADLRRMP